MLTGSPKPDTKPDGLFLTVRAGSDAGETIPGADPDLDDMLQLAAERLFETTQPGAADQRSGGRLVGNGQTCGDAAATGRR